MINIIKRSIAKFSNQKNSKLQPLYMQIEQKLNDSKKITPTENIENLEYQLVRKQDSILCKYWWSESAFEDNQDLKIPVFSLRKNEFNKEYIHLEPLIFNQPIRRDLIHKAYLHSQMFDQKTYHRTLKPYEVSGRGSKVRQQKGSGRARWGTLRGSGKTKPGKSWGHIPKDFTLILPVKMKLKALQAVLSAKLAEGKVIIYDNEQLTQNNPGHLVSLLPSTENQRLIFVHPKQTANKFEKILTCVKNVKGVNPNQINVKDLVEYDRIIFTKQSLKEFTELFLAYLFYQNKPKIVQNERVNQILNFNVDQTQPDQGDIIFDPIKGFEPKFQVLQDYYEHYKKLQEEGKLDEYEEKHEKYVQQIKKNQIKYQFQQ